jgi:hypothetical protein
MQRKEIMMTFWISCRLFTVSVDTVGPHGTIVDGAPIIMRKFKGRPIIKLINWAEKLGGLRWKRIV